MITIADGHEDICRAAAKQHVIVVVDALRASASLCALLHAGARQVSVCAGPSDARTLYTRRPEALLVGEEGGRKPDDFHWDNSPSALVRGQFSEDSVIFTSTNGAPALTAARGAAAVYVGSPVNATRIAAAVEKHLQAGQQVCIAPAESKNQESVEDYASAALLAHVAGPNTDPAREVWMAAWLGQIADGGLLELFRRSPLGRKLIARGLADDVDLCAAVDALPVLPAVIRYTDEDGICVAVLADEQKPARLTPD